MAERLSANLPGIGGLFKQRPEDFGVEEIPRYLPSGSGCHLYLRLEKIGLSTFELVHQLAKALGITEQLIGYAGLKDARARTIQTVSLPADCAAAVESLNLPGVRILTAAYHGNKLRLGHLAGNRFDILVRKVGIDAEERAKDILQLLQDLGMPNRFGEQRYGLLNNSQQIGALLLRRQWQDAVTAIIGNPEQIRNHQWRRVAELYQEQKFRSAADRCPPRMRDEARLLRTLAAGAPAEEAVLKLPRKRLRLYLSALQSDLFDRLVDMRLATIERLWDGDLAYLHDRGACFLVTDPAAEQERADRLEISPTGAMFGTKVSLASGAAGLLETALLEKEGLKLGSFRLGKGLKMEGERRPLRVPVGSPEIIDEGENLRLRFSLPPGSYATVLLDEVMKTQLSDPRVQESDELPCPSPPGS